MFGPYFYLIIWFGSHKISCGKMVNRISAIMIIVMNGITPLIISLIVMPNSGGTITSGITPFSLF